MSEAEFRTLLASDRERACRLLAERKVEEWMEDGAEEVVRCLALWMENKQDLGDDEFLVDRAMSCDLIS